MSITHTYTAHTGLLLEIVPCNLFRVLCMQQEQVTKCTFFKLFALLDQSKHMYASFTIPSSKGHITPTYMQLAFPIKSKQVQASKGSKGQNMQTLTLPQSQISQFHIRQGILLFIYAFFIEGNKTSVTSTAFQHGPHSHYKMYNR